MYGDVYVCGDTHSAPLFYGDAGKLNPERWTESRMLTKDDVLIQLGDFGYVWYTLGTNVEQEKMLDKLANLSYTIAVIPGNHENYNEIFGLPEINKRGGKVWELKRKTGSIYFLQRGETYNINGRKILAIGGALSIDKARRIEDKSWWQLEYLTEKERGKAIENIKKHNYQFDYILTHTAPISIVKEILGKDYFSGLVDEVSVFLETILNSGIDFKQWHFGHLHKDVIIKKRQKEFFCHYNELPFPLD